ncbi:hypothetical protein DSCW_57780 [Desulfosarcina widdelii]|uniref:DUF3108 domain-containing protein n=1 Tax=Desulfosarcina widdelii TaxID=947919 RepID=A0A5K7ZF01_9BACT|nr:hypothetical protein [Desulfosarcina widdelii]BBO78361.1 hypothetical protein DSCW_57780 [Desulfosarcina widdelii]
MKLQKNLSRLAILVWAPILLAVFVLVPIAAAAPAMPMTDEEIHHYREVTGTTSEEVCWHLTRGDTLILTYTSPTERHVTTTGSGYRTIRWQVTDTADGTDFVAERSEDTIVIKGRFKGEPIHQRLDIDDAPWYQATSLSLRGLIASNDSHRVFWTIRPDTLTPHKIKAVKKEIETVASEENQKKLQHIRLRTTGMLAPFWKSDYWFTLPRGIFQRFEGPSGPPGSPMTVVTRLDR